jgi:hypothetical protein
MKFYVLRLVDWLPNAARQTKQPQHCNLPEGMVHCLGISRRAICVLGGSLSKKIGRHGFGCKKKFKNLTLGPNPKTSEEKFRQFNDTRVLK